MIYSTLLILGALFTILFFQSNLTGEGISIGDTSIILAASIAAGAAIWDGTIRMKKKDE